MGEHERATEIMRDAIRNDLSYDRTIDKLNRANLSVEEHNRVVDFAHREEGYRQSQRERHEREDRG